MNKIFVKKFIFANLTIVFLYLTAQLLMLKFTHFGWLVSLPSILLWILPQFNLVIALYLFSKKKLSKEFFLFSFITLTPIISGVVFYCSMILKGNIDVNFIVLSYLVYWLLTFLSCICLLKQSTTLFNSDKWSKTFFLIAGFSILYILANIFIYWYLPGFDSYKYLAETTYILQKGKLLPISNEVLTRPFWYALLAGFESFTRIPAYWLLKLVLPLFSASIFIPFYLLVKSKTNKKLVIFIISLIPFLFPVLTQEIATGRPQNLFILLLPLVIFFSCNFYKEEFTIGNLWVWLFFFLMNCLGFRYHPFFVLSLPILLVCLFAKLKPYYQKNKLYFIASLFLFTVLTYPWLEKILSGAKLAVLFHPFLEIAQHPTWRWWFLSSYKDVYGNLQSWPPFYFYYGYYLGLVLPLILVFKITNPKKTGQKYFYSLLLPTVILCLIATEILPRLGLYYFPDRFWLWFDISIAFMLVESLINLLKKNTFSIVLISFVILTLSLNLYLSWSKNGFISKPDLEAAEFVNKNLPVNAVFLEQSNYYPLVEYFFGRRLVIINSNNSINFDNLSDIQKFAEKNSLEKGNSLNLVLDTLKKYEKQFSDEPVNNYNKLFGNFMDEISLLSFKTNASLLQYQYPISDNNELYYVEKIGLKELFGKGVWWRDEENSKKRDYPPHFEKVYSNDDITIWKIKI